MGPIGRVSLAMLIAAGLTACAGGGGEGVRDLPREGIPADEAPDETPDLPPEEIQADVPPDATPDVLPEGIAADVAPGEVPDVLPEGIAADVAPDEMPEGFPDVREDSPDPDAPDLAGLALLRAGLFEVEADPVDGSFRVRDTVRGTGADRLHLGVQVPEGKGGWRDAWTLGHPMTCVAADGPGVRGMSCEADTGIGIAARVTLSVRDARPEALLWETSFTNRSGGAKDLHAVVPFRAAAEDAGALVIGSDPATVRVLQNGSDAIVDFYVDLMPGDWYLTAPEDNALTWGYSSWSSGSALAFDPASGASLLAGFLRMDWTVPLVAMSGAEAPPAPLPDGRVPLSVLQAEARFRSIATLPDGATVDGGLAVLVAGTASPFDALEAYGDEVARVHDIVLPPAPLSGWDSWYTGVATDIDEAFIADSAARLADTFGAFGLSGLDIDMGWQDRWGDWNAAPAFPSGIAASAAAVKAEGLKPELWMAPFSAEESSAAWQAHPEWFLPKDLWGSILMSGTQHAYDLGLPEVMERVREVGARARDWGLDAVKLDFAYYGLFVERPESPGRTVVSLYRDAMRSFREALGTGVFLTNVSMCFPSIGLVDAHRYGLDTWPCWEGGTSCKVHKEGGISAMGVKPAVRMAARRYWMNGRLWWNHQDQVFTRDLSIEESRAWMSVMAVAGGMVSLGEDMRTLSPESADSYRRILPLQPLSGRPLDLFRREFPETWVQRQEEPEGVVAGFFHWGGNRDLAATPYAHRADGTPVQHDLPLEQLGLDPSGTYAAWEFWTAAPVEIREGRLRMVLEPHSARIVRIVPVGDAPVWLATDRHVLMGPGIVSGLAWDAASGELRGTVLTVSGLPQSLVFAVPSGRSVASVSVGDAQAVLAVPVAGIVEATVTVTADGPVRFVLRIAP